jgi:RNA polymerase sigma-70 factor (ECF subfamily)
MSDGLDAEQLFRSHARFVARFLVRLGVHPDDLDDTVQEVFLVAHQRGGYRPGPAKPTSYLATIALHAAANQRRRRSVASARTESHQPDELHTQALDPVQQLERAENVRALEGALATLSPLLRATLLLIEHEGESCRSVAASMAVPVGTVYWRLYQAKRLFRRAVEAQLAADELRGTLGKQVVP